MSLIRSFLTVSFFTMLSRIFGFVRDILIAAFLGTGVLAEAFFVAFKLPNTFRRFFAEGAFNAAFVPMFSEKLARKDHTHANLFANKIFSLLAVSLLIFVVVVEVTMPWIMTLLAPGFVGDAEKFAHAVTLGRITFPYLLFISLVCLLGGILNSFQKFVAGAAAPILLNLCLIGFMVGLGPFMEHTAYALAWGVAVAGVVQFWWLWKACRKTPIQLRLEKPVLDRQTKGFLKRMAPGIFGAGVMQINLWVDTIIATFIPGAVAYLYYADKLNFLPLSMIGTAMGTALLPTLSQRYSSGDNAKAMQGARYALSFTLMLGVPAACALWLMAEPIIRVLFERGQFTAADTLATAYALMAYTIGLPAYVCVKVFSTMYFAQKDTKTPVQIAVICLLANIGLNFLFIALFRNWGYMPHIGIALATAITSWLNVSLLMIILIKRGLFVLDRLFAVRAFKTIIASLWMTAGLCAMLWLLESWLQSGSTGLGMLALLICVGGGIALYGVAVIVTKLMTPTQLRQREFL